MHPYSFSPLFTLVNCPIFFPYNKKTLWQTVRELRKDKRETGFEPAALALGRRCSTTEPLAHCICKNNASIIHQKHYPHNPLLKEFIFYLIYLQNCTQTFHLKPITISYPDLLVKPSTD